VGSDLLGEEAYLVRINAVFEISKVRDIFGLNNSVALKQMLGT